MSSKRTHRSKRQERDDAKVQAKRARQELAPEDEPNLEEIPLGVDNGSHFHEDNARYKKAQSVVSVLIFNKISCSVEMVLLLQKFGTPTAARNEWIRLYGNENVPARTTFSRNLKKFKKTGCMHNQVCILS